MKNPQYIFCAETLKNFVGMLLKENVQLLYSKITLMLIEAVISGTCLVLFKVSLHMTLTK